MDASLSVCEEDEHACSKTVFCLPKQSSVLHVVLHFEEQHQGQLSLLDNLLVRERC